MDHLITISLDANGDFTHSPSAVHALSGENVYWGSIYPFTIQFQDESPLVAPVSSSVTISSETGLTAEGLGTALPCGTPPAPVDDEAKGNYHYAVALWDGYKVRIDAGCPVIICN